MSYLLVKHNDTYKITNKVFIKYNGNYKRVNKVLKKINNTWQSIWQRQTEDVCLLQFNDFIDQAGNIWQLNSDPQIVEDNESISGRCLYVDGYASISQEESDISNFGIDEFTIEFWCNQFSEGLSSYPCLYYAAAEITESRIFAIIADSEVVNILFINSGETKILSAPLNVFDGKWHHMVIVRDVTGEIIFFYDGIKQILVGDETNWSDINIDFKSTFIGHLPDSERVHECKIDQFRISKKARYSKDFTPIKRPYMFND